MRCTEAMIECLGTRNLKFWCVALITFWARIWRVPSALALEARWELSLANRSLYFLESSGLELSEKYRFAGVQTKLEFDSRAMTKNVNFRNTKITKTIDFLTNLLKFRSNVTSWIHGRLISFCAQKNRRIFLFQNFATVFGITMLHFACYSHYISTFWNSDIGF